MTAQIEALDALIDELAEYENLAIESAHKWRFARVARDRQTRAEWKSRAAAFGVAASCVRAYRATLA